MVISPETRVQEIAYLVDQGADSLPRLVIDLIARLLVINIQYGRCFPELSVVASSLLRGPVR